MTDVIVIGGGVIGLSATHELAGRGLAVTLLDRQQPGQEASWAGAGILPAGHPGPAEHPLGALCRLTHQLWPQLTRELHEETGIDNGFVECGGLQFSPDADRSALDAEINLWEAAGVTIERGTDGDLSKWEPSLGPQSGPAFRLPETRQVRNPRHLKSLQAACVRRGVQIRSGEPVLEILHSADKITGVRTPGGDSVCDAVLVTAGPWTQQLLSRFDCRRTIEPVRGQMILLSTPAPLLSHIIECGPRYIVPRLDGRTLIGSTEEWVGFDKRNTPAGMRRLMEFAIRMVPELADARFEQAWSGLRPHSVDGLPLLGRFPSFENLYVAAGHFRAGLHLSPITARVITQLMCGEPTAVDVAPFLPAVD